MPRLLALRYVNIGHASARCDDLMLDLIDPAGRPSETTVWLRNGGGKSQAITLFFTLIRPRKREFLGQTADGVKRQLTDYVHKNDRSLVLAEWELDGTPLLTHVLAGPRLITGVFYERRDGHSDEQALGDEQKIAKLFFALRVQAKDPATTLAGLPIYTDDARTQRRTLAAFRRELEAIRTRTPQAQVATTQELGEWADILRGHGIDPDLFQYQLRMNEKEGGADRIFQDCTTVQDYVDLCLEILVDRNAGLRIHENLSRHKEELARRYTELEPGLALVRELAPTLGSLADLARRRGDITDRGLTLRASIDGALAWAALRGQDLQTLQVQHSEDRRRYQEEVGAAEGRAEAARLRAAQFHRDALCLRWRAAQAAEKEHAAMLQQRRQAMEQWDCALPLRDALNLEAEAAQVEAQIRTLEIEHEPLRLLASTAASRLVRALRAEEGRLLTIAEQYEVAAAAHTTTRDAAQHEANDALREATAAEGEADRHHEAAARADRERDDLRKRGDLEADESVPDAERRYVRLLPELEAAVENAAEERSAALANRVLAHQQADSARAALAQAEWATDHVRRDLAEATRHGAVLASSDLLREVLELDAIPVERLGAEALDLVQMHSADATQCMLTLRATRSRDERFLEALGDNGLLPLSEDVTAVLTAIGPVATGSYSGWTYLGDSRPVAEARRLIECAPEIATGVVVRDADFAAAVSTLHQATLALDGAVLVATQSAATALLAGPERALEAAAQRVVVGPSSNAQFNRDAARAERTERAERLERIVDELRAFEGRRAALEKLAVQLEEFLTRYGSAWFATTRAALETAETLAAAAARARQEADAAVIAADERVEHAQEALDEARQTLMHMRERQRRVTEYLGRHGTDPDAPRRLADAAALRATKGHARRSDAAARAGAADAEAREALERRTQVIGEAGIIAKEAGSVLYQDPSATGTPEPGDLPPLRTEYELRRATYEGKVQSSDLTFRLHDLTQRAKEARARFVKKLNKRWEEAAIRGLLTSLPTMEAAEDEAARAKDAHFDALSAQSRVAGAVTKARGDVEAAIEAGSKVGLLPVELQTLAGELPLDPDGRLAERWMLEATAQRAAAEDAASEVSAAEQLVLLADNALQRTKTDATRLDGLSGTIRTAVDQQSALLGRFLVTQEAVARAPRPASLEELAALVPQCTGELKALAGATAALDAELTTRHQAAQAALSRPEYVGQRHALFNRMREAEPRHLEQYAAGLCEDLATREQHLEGALRDLEQHHDTLVQLTLMAADEGRRRLHEVGLRSTIPDQVPNQLGGKPFVKIGGVERSSDPAADRRAAETLVKSWAKSPKGIPSALELIQEAVHAVAPKIRMQILFPDASRGARWEPIEHLVRWSGGERLTCATLLYCTLARVRAMSRGEVGTATGVLICDNPQGTASRPTFLLAQREVARALGIQLVYFTGIADYEAVRVMPNTIRIRNGRYDRRTGDQVLEIVPVEEGSEDAPTLRAARIARDEAALHVPPLTLATPSPDDGVAPPTA